MVDFRRALVQPVLLRFSVFILISAVPLSVARASIYSYTDDAGIQTHRDQWLYACLPSTAVTKSRQWAVA